MISRDLKSLTWPLKSLEFFVTFFENWPIWGFDHNFWTAQPILIIKRSFKRYWALASNWCNFRLNIIHFRVLFRNFSFTCSFKVTQFLNRVLWPNQIVIKSNWKMFWKTADNSFPKHVSDWFYHIWFAHSIRFSPGKRQKTVPTLHQGKRQTFAWYHIPLTM